jgi:hypothetical protein
MKMIMTVFMIRMIVSWIDNKIKVNKNATDADIMNTEHPAEFRIR